MKFILPCYPSDTLHNKLYQQRKYPNQTNNQRKATREKPSYGRKHSEKCGKKSKWNFKLNHYIKAVHQEIR